MDGQNYVIFHNAVDDSYMNTTTNFRGAYASTETVDIYFKAAAVGNGADSAGYDKIIVVCENGEEDRAVEQLAAVMAGSINPVTIVADDVNSVYACPDISAVTSTTMGATGRYDTVEDITAVKTLYAYDSGKTFMLNQTSGAYAVNLPNASDAAAGWNARFILKTAASNALTIVATAGDGDNIIARGLDMEDGAVGSESQGCDVITFISGALAGDEVTLTCDGTSYYAHSVASDAAHIAYS